MSTQHKSNLPEIDKWLPKCSGKCLGIDLSIRAVETELRITCNDCHKTCTHQISQMPDDILETLYLGVVEYAGIC